MVKSKPNKKTLNRKTNEDEAAERLAEIFILQIEEMRKRKKNKLKSKNL